MTDFDARSKALWKSFHAPRASAFPCAPSASCVLTSTFVRCKLQMTRCGLTLVSFMMQFRRCNTIFLVYLSAPLFTLQLSSLVWLLQTLLALTFDEAADLSFRNKIWLYITIMRDRYDNLCSGVTFMGLYVVVIFLNHLTTRVLDQETGCQEKEPQHHLQQAVTVRSVLVFCVARLCHKQSRESCRSDRIPAG